MHKGLRLVYHPGGVGPEANAGGAERRRFRRFPLGRAVKLRCGVTGHYLPGEGLDASSGGALVRMAHDANLPLGHPVLVGIPWRQDALLLSDELIDGRVVRCLGHGDHRYVAVAFDVPVFLAQAG